MSFNEIVKRALVEGQPVDVTPNTTAGDILQTVGQDPNTRSLVQTNPDGTAKILRTNDRINTSNGNNFDVQMRGIGG